MRDNARDHATESLYKTNMHDSVVWQKPFPQSVLNGPSLLALFSDHRFRHVSQANASCLHGQGCGVLLITIPQDERGTYRHV